MKVAIIGGGSMGTAFVRCWLKKEVLAKDDVFIIENSKERIEQIVSEFHFNVSQDYSLLDEAKFIFIAVKPQDFLLVSGKLNKILKPEQVVVSIMAGMPISKISQALSLDCSESDNLNNHKRIVRVMPNLPILVSKGISAYYAHPDVEHVALNIIEQLLKAGGDVVKLESEELLNSVTALSGSGPGFVFFMLQHLMKSAIELGFNEEQARSLISQTIKGSIDLWRHDSRTAKELCKAVTSKGGTTEAALYHFEKNNLGQILEDGVLKAKKKAEELALS